MIQDLINQHYDNTYVKKSPKACDCVLIFKNGQVMIKQQACSELPLYKECETDLEAYVYLFSVDDKSYYLGKLMTDKCIEGYTFEPINSVRTIQPKEVAFAVITGFHLFNWYRTNQYCGGCQGKMIHSEKERALRCEKCGSMVFPRISPAIIVGVTDGDRLLMTKYARREYKKYALVAGFCEIGESAERTVEREVMEEVGLKVKNIRYYKSQPWGLAGDLLLGYFAEVDGAMDIRMDEEELSEAVWIKREDIDFEADGVTLTSEMIMHFKHNKM